MGCRRRIMQEPLADTIELEFQAAALELAKKCAEADMLKANPLLPKDLLIQRYQKQLEQEFTSHRALEKQGALALQRALEELQKASSDFLSEDDKQGIFRLAKLSEVIEADEERFTQHLANGGTLQELVGVADATMDKLYKAAKHLFDQGLFDDAAGAYTFLCGINHKSYLFWLGLAYSEYSRKRFNEAKEAFGLVCAANPQDPYAFLAASRCYEQLQEPDKALDAIEKALKAGEQKPDFAQLADMLKNEKTRLLQTLHH